MITDPRFAPKRDDLPWLRRRRVPRSVASPPPAAAPADPVATHEAVTDFVTGHATGHRHDPTPASSSSLDLDDTATHEAVADFMSGHATGHPQETAAPPSSSSLDLDEPAPAPRPASPSSSSLDLDEPVPQPARPARPARQPEPVGRRRVDVRVKAENRVILTVSDPTVTLTRLQSGIGALTIEAACSDEVGDLRIGCAYELASGATSTVQLTQGNRLAPPRSRRPILVASHERFETIGVDLRQCTDIRRLVVYAFSESRSALNWGGTLIITTLGGARVELPLEALQSGDAAILQSIYNVRGEFVLRAEMLTVFGGVREACRSYGFDKITWLDDRTPVD